MSKTIDAEVLYRLKIKEKKQLRIGTEGAKTDGEINP